MSWVHDPMRITWDPSERDKTKAERGLDFEDAAEVLIGTEPVSSAEGQAALAANIRRRGRPARAGGEEHVKLRTDGDLMAAFRATGPGWQSRMNEALRKAAGL